MSEGGGRQQSRGLKHFAAVLFLGQTAILARKISRTVHFEDMHAQHTRNGNIDVVRIEGRLDSVTAPELETVLQQIMDAGAVRILLDCGELKYVSSMGLRVFMIAGKLLEARQGSLAFAGLNPSNSHIFEMTRLSTLFRCYPTVAEALAAW